MHRSCCMRMNGTHTLLRTRYLACTKCSNCSGIRHSDDFGSQPGYLDSRRPVHPIVDGQLDQQTYGQQAAQQLPEQYYRLQTMHCIGAAEMQSLQKQEGQLEQARSKNDGGSAIIVTNGTRRPLGCGINRNVLRLRNWIGTAISPSEHLVDGEGLGSILYSVYSCHASHIFVISSIRSFMVATNFVNHGSIPAVLYACCSHRAPILEQGILEV